jgi:TRAP transporter TAXI family solute receptor
MEKLYKIFRITMAALVAVTVCGMASPSQAEAAAIKTYTFGTSGATGAQYIIGVAMANEINRASQTINIATQATAGGGEDIVLVNAGEMDFGYSNTNTLYNYQNAAGWITPEEKAEHLNGVMALQPSYGQWMALKSSNIHSIEDLKGKRVCIGTTSASVSLMSRGMLTYYGIDADKDLASAVLLSQSEACDKLSDGDLDAIFLMAAYPMAAYTNLLVDDRYNMIDVPAEVLQKVIDQSFPSYEVGIIPAGTYPHIDEDIHAMYARNAIFCRDSLPDDDVYEFVKQTFDNWDAIKLGHAVLPTLSFKDFPHTGIPLHPGAEKYYKEIGIM